MTSPPRETLNQPQEPITTNRTPNTHTTSHTSHTSSGSSPSLPLPLTPPPPPPRSALSPLSSSSSRGRFTPLPANLINAFRGEPHSPPPVPPSDGVPVQAAMVVRTELGEAGAGTVVGGAGARRTGVVGGPPGDGQEEGRGVDFLPQTRVSETRVMSTVTASYLDRDHASATPVVWERSKTNQRQKTRDGRQGGVRRAQVNPSVIVIILELFTLGN